MSKILVVDENEANLTVLENILQKRGYETELCRLGAGAMALVQEKPYDLLLINPVLSDLGGFELCAELKKDEFLSRTPVIFIAADDSYNIMKGYEVGGVDYIPVPFKEPEVLGRIGAHVRIIKLQEEIVDQRRSFEEKIQKEVQDITATQMATIFSLAKLAQSKDDSGLHLERVQRYCFVLAEDLSKTSKYYKDIDEKFIKDILHASPLHDIGKVGIPDRILLKPARLTFDEFEIMKTHTLIGAETLQLVKYKFGDNKFIEMGIDIARSHHERWDGKGYPHKLKEDEIPLSARIMSIADVYDALRMKRVYKAAYTKEKANTIIAEGSGTQFDPVMVASFKRVADKFDGIYREWAD